MSKEFVLSSIEENHPHILNQLKGCLCYEPRVSFSQNPIHQILSSKNISNTLTLLGRNNIPICKLGVSFLEFWAHIQVFLLLRFNAQRATLVCSAHSYAQHLCNFALAQTAQCAARCLMRSAHFLCAAHTCNTVHGFANTVFRPLILEHALALIVGEQIDLFSPLFTNKISDFI